MMANLLIPIKSSGVLFLLLSPFLPYVRVFPDVHLDWVTETKWVCVSACCIHDCVMCAVCCVCVQYMTELGLRHNRCALLMKQQSHMLCSDNQSFLL